MKYHTQKNESITHAPPKSNILLWHQAPKPKGWTAGQEQTSQALRCGERSETEWHHHLTLDSELLDQLEQAVADPLTLK